MSLNPSNGSRIVALILLAVGVPTTAVLLDRAVGATTEVPERLEGRALLDAAQAELDQAWAALRHTDHPPYFIEIEIIDRHRVQVEATHGAAGAVQEDHSRRADIDVRVGSPMLDNTHKLRDAGWFAEPDKQAVQLPLSALDPFPTRMALWSALDDAYRSAVKRLIQVKSNNAVKVASDDPSPDFSSATPVVDVRDDPPLEVDGKVWQDRVRAASAVFLDYPAVQDSNVSFLATDEMHTLLTTEGTRIAFRRHHLRVAVWASTIADDGMKLEVYDYVDAMRPDKLPDRAALVKLARGVAERVTALRRAPLVQPYVGPAILRGRAAAVFFHEILGHRVEGHRLKDDSDAQTLVDKVGKQIFPSFINVYDDPTLMHWGKVDLDGYYPYDDEGVPAQRVEIVTHGRLDGFLMSRSPIRGFEHSNGHGRRQPGNHVVARQGNLVVQADRTVPYPKLRQMLIDEINRQGKPFGLIFDDISGGFTFTGRSNPNSFSVQPVTVWKVFADGRPDELVRGVDMIGTPLAAFSRIEAASDRTEVFNGLCGAESGWVPVAAIAPDLLMKEVEVQRHQKANDRPPLLPPPTPESEEASR